APSAALPTTRTSRTPSDQADRQARGNHAASSPVRSKRRSQNPWEGLTMRTRTLGIGLLIGVVPLALASCGKGESKSSSAGSAAFGRPAAGAGGAILPRSPSAPAGVDLAVAKRPAADR